MSMSSNISSSYSSPSVFSPIPPQKFQSLLANYAPLVSSSSNFVATNVLSDEALTIAAAKEAVSLAISAVKAAKEAVVLASGSGERGNADLIARRKKRRKRRKGFDYLEMEEEKKNTLCEGALPEPVNCGYLSPIEEAQLCLSLKDEASLEVARRRITENQEHEPTMKQLANAMRMGKRSIDKIACKGRVSREKITRNYRRLVISVASSYRGKGVSLEDLIQEGSIGLLRGAERFDPSRGNKLSTYAYWWIKEAIITSISKKSRLDKITKIAQAKIDLRKRLGRLPSYDEIAEVLNIKVSTVRLGIQTSRSPLSLDRAASDQGGMTIKCNAFLLKEIIPGPDEMRPEKMLEKELIKQDMEKLMETLSEREACILRLSFGLNGQTPQSHEEIGRLMKLSRERIRQINKIALSKLRYRSIMDDLKVYIV